jgi:hypothetical protein
LQGPPIALTEAEEFENFERLTEKLLKVPKEDVDEERRKAQDASKNGRPRTT